MALGTGLSVNQNGTLSGAGINAQPTNNSAFATSGSGNLGSQGFTPPATNAVANSGFGAGMSITPSGGFNSPYVNPSNAGIASLLLGQSPAQTVKTTPTGGTAFNPQAVSQYSSPVAPKPEAPVAPTVAQGGGNLSSFITGQYQTPNGGTITTDNSGNVTGFNPAQGYNINTQTPTPSSALNTNTTYGDLSGQRNQYMDYLQGLAGATQYSPAYLQALQASQNAQLQGAQITSDATFNSHPGSTLGAVQESAQMAGVANSFQQMAATNALALQNAIRTGNIGAYQALVQGTSPSTLNQSVSPGSTIINGSNGQPIYSGLGGLIGVNGINSVNSLSNAYPGAGILPTDSITTAQQKVAASPAYQAQFQSTYTQPGGGTGIYNKLNTGALTQNQDGTLSLVSSASAALGAGQSSALGQQVQNYNNTQTAFNTANTTLGTMIQFMNSAGINQSSVPIINQIQNKVKAGALDPGAVAAFNADIAELRTNYAQVLSRGGSVAGTNDSAAQLIPNDLSPAQLTQVLGQLTQNGQNALTAIGGQISSITGALSGQPQQSSVSNGSNPFSPSNFVIGGH